MTIDTTGDEEADANQLCISEQSILKLAIYEMLSRMQSIWPRNKAKALLDATTKLE